MKRSVRITSPPGYGAVTPLDRRRHAGHGRRAEAPYAWCSALTAVYLSAPEFGRAALDYPIAFARDPRDREFQPVAVLGLQAGRNLFVDAQGQWQPGLYVPAWCRRYPFCVAELPGADAVRDARRLICVNEAALAPAAAEPLFGPDGSPTPAWAPLQQLIEQLEGARMQTRVLCRRLEALGLLRPFDAVAVPRDGARTRLKGLYRIDETRLEHLDGRQLRTLQRKGELRAAYAHLLSLENFGRLMTRAGGAG